MATINTPRFEGRKVDLLPMLPKAGFRWPEGDHLTRLESSSRRRDQRIVEVLCHHGNCPRLAPGGKGKGKARDEVSLALSQMFDEAATLIRNEDAAKRRTYKLVGIDLFYELYLARARWHTKPQYPYNVEEHGVLAQSIDNFQSANGGGSWKLPDIEYFDLCGGFMGGKDFDGDEADEEDVNDGEGDVEEGEEGEKKGHWHDFIAATGESSQQDDVEMQEETLEDEEVLEARVRLDRVDLEEGEMMDTDEQ